MAEEAPDLGIQLALQIITHETFILSNFTAPYLPLCIHALDVCAMWSTVSTVPCGPLCSLCHVVQEGLSGFGPKLPTGVNMTCVKDFCWRH